MSTRIHPFCPRNFQNYPSIQDTSTKLKKFTLAAQKAQFAKTVNPFYELCSRSISVLFISVWHTAGSWKGSSFGSSATTTSPLLLLRLLRGPIPNPLLETTTVDPTAAHCTGLLSLVWNQQFNMLIIVEQIFLNYCLTI